MPYSIANQSWSVTEQADGTLTLKSQDGKITLPNLTWEQVRDLGGISNGATDEWRKRQTTAGP